MDTDSRLWTTLRRPRGPLTRSLHRAGTTATGTYAAYLLHGLRHPDLLRSAVSAEERGEALPGDLLVVDPDWVRDFGADIVASAEQVWPWLIQIGYGRAGWYTWYPLDNGGRDSAERIVPELQELAVGDAIADGPRAAEGFGVWRVIELDRPQAMVLHSRRNPFTGHELAPGEGNGEPWIDTSWAFALREPGPGRCRLRVRVRARFHGGRWGAVVTGAARRFFGLGDNVMERTMLDGIRRRAERAAARS